MGQEVVYNSYVVTVSDTSSEAAAENGNRVDGYIENLSDVKTITYRYASSSDPSAPGQFQRLAPRQREFFVSPTGNFTKQALQVVVDSGTAELLVVQGVPA